MSIHLYNKDTGARIAELTDEQFDELSQYLEEEGPEDHDYWMNGEVVDYMEEEGADPELVKLLRTAVGTSEDGIEIQWKEA